MLLYVYIIFFLICIKCTICYEYYDVKLNRRNTGRFNSNSEDNTKRKFHSDKHQAQFDVASFIQNNAKSGPEDDNLYAYGNDYNVYGSLADTNVDKSVKLQEKSQEYLNSGRDKIQFEDIVHRDSVTSKSLDDMNVLNFPKDVKLHKDKNIKEYDEKVPLSLVHNPEKKCSFRNMKFPFFSHNTSDKTKKQKRRKIFSFDSKNVENETNKGTKFAQTQTIKKRSYKNKLSLCPVCKRKFRNDNYDDADKGELENRKTATKQ